MMKAKRLHHKYFDNDLQKFFPINVFEKATGNRFLIVLLIAGLCIDNSLISSSTGKS